MDANALAGEPSPAKAFSFEGDEEAEAFGTPAAPAGNRPPSLPSPAAPPKKPRSAADQASGSARRNAVAPRPKTPAPGSSIDPADRQTIVTPNLWGPDSAIMRQPDVVERDLSDESLQKRKKLPRKVMIAIYIACVLAVIAIVTILVLVLSPLPEPSFIASCDHPRSAAAALGPISSG